MRAVDPGVPPHVGRCFIFLDTKGCMSIRDLSNFEACSCDKAAQ